jgi:hypothetical protein
VCGPPRTPLGDNPYAGGDWEKRAGMIKRVLINRPTRGENAAAGARKKTKKNNVDVIN